MRSIFNPFLLMIFLLASSFVRLVVSILEREAALRLFVGDRLAQGWTPGQIPGWLKSGNEPRLRAIRL